MAISTCTPTWIQEIVGSYIDDPHVQEILIMLLVDSQGPSLGHYSTRVHKKKGKVYVGSHRILKQHLISTFHDTPLGGHSGQLETLKRLAQHFYWPNMKLMKVFPNPEVGCHIGSGGSVHQALFKLLGTQLHYNSAYHPSSDGQTERVKRCLENYMSCMVSN
ncbi:hypothetical protein KY290_007688 [Solanum tuberosum]|uniref:Integrase zinc-binding domain-containing protein n=1 Tax=Solanum tuberosum TaxID=4113 RepID=A0ABQ7W6E4_SOLTU|nr:hypothetical protein KY290_007688 [Solanum tuberosum]